LVNGTTRLTSSFEDLLNRSNNFQGLADKLDGRVEESNKLIQFLNDHYKQLEERGELIRDSVVKVEDVMIKSLKQLEEHTQIKIDAIKQITIKEEDLMTKAFVENRSHISKLSLLEDLKKSIEEFKKTLKSISLEMTQKEFQTEVGRLEVLGELLIRNEKK
jgi:valyl-tRNA synthetase